MKLKKFFKIYNTESKGEKEMKRLLITTLLLTCLIGMVLAETPITYASGGQSWIKGVANSSQGVIYSWMDDRNASSDIYVQSMDSALNPLWTINGLAICTAVKNQQYPQIASNGNSGAYIVWQDERGTTATNFDIYAQCVSSQGSTLWQTNGLAICNATGNQFYPIVCNDSTGAIIAWYDHRNGDMLYAQKINSAGSTLWNLNGVAVDTMVNSAPQIASDGNGGAWVAAYNNATTVSVYHLSNNGTVIEQQIFNGVKEFSLADKFLAFNAIDGNGLWLSNQTWLVKLSDASTASPKLAIQDGSAIVAWRDFRNGNADLYAQKVTSVGSTLWSNNGLAICTVNNAQYSPTIVSDGLGGGIISWYDNRLGNFDIYAQRIKADGKISLPANGLAVCTANSTQQLPQLVSDGKSGSFVAWEDFRNGNLDLYVQNIDSSKYQIDGAPPAIISFIVNPTSGYSPLTVNFYGAYSGESVSVGICGNGWFANGTSANHVYPDLGYDYVDTTKFIVVNPYGLATTSIVVSILSKTARAPKNLVLTGDPLFGFASLTTKFVGSFSGESSGLAQKIYGSGWTFDGSSINHIYSDPGFDYTDQVIYYVKNSFGESSTVLLVSIFSKELRRPKITSFVASPTSGYSPLAVSFLGNYSGDSGTAIIYGNGWFANGTSANHTYFDLGYDYTDTAKFVVTNFYGSATASVVVSVLSKTARAPKNLMLTGDPLSGFAPLTTKFVGSFSAESSGLVQKIYGNGWLVSGSSTNHLYPDSGSDYTDSVVYYVKNDYGESSTALLISILSKEYRRPHAGFYATPTSGVGNFAVYFYDTSANSPNAWYWDFGDGATSVEQNPVHTYALSTIDRTFNVKLIVSNSYGSDTAIKYALIYSVGTCTTNRMPADVNFYGMPTVGRGSFSTNFFGNGSSVNSWRWDFGDGVTSNEKNPIHVYSLVTADTYYSVQLIASNAYGAVTVRKNNYIFCQATCTTSVVYGDPTMPNPKLFIGQSIASAFDLQYYNSITAANYAAQGFAGLVNLNGGLVNQGAYGAPTVGSNVFVMQNGLSIETGFNKVKYSTYKLRKLPRLGMNVGDVEMISISNYSFSSSGPAIPESFGDNGSLIVSDPAKISAVWSGTTAINITALSGLTSFAYVEVVAAPTIAPFGADFDRERIYIYPNLLGGPLTFSAASEISDFAFENTEAGKPLPNIGWNSGCLQLVFSSNTQEVKATLKISRWVNYGKNLWYTARFKVRALTANNQQQLLCFNYSNVVPTPADSQHVDIVGNIYYNLSTTWQWIEIPLQSLINSDYCYPQFIGKGIGTLLIDEVQVINAAPDLTKPRGDCRSHFAGGDWDSFSDVSCWGIETDPGEISMLDINSGNLTLQFGNSDGKAKFTARQANGIYTPATELGKEVGLKLKVISTSDFSQGLSSMVLLGVYGTDSEGSYAINSQLSASNNFLALAQIGEIINSEMTLAGKTLNPWNQFQFQVKGKAQSTIRIGAVDFLRDCDDPNFGDWRLY